MTEEIVIPGAKLEKQCAAMRAALEEIKLGKGRFSRDRLQFAENVIEEQKEIATKVLDETDAGKGWASPEDWAAAEQKNELLIQTIEGMKGWISPEDHNATCADLTSAKADLIELRERLKKGERRLEALLERLQNLETLRDAVQKAARHWKECDACLHGKQCNEWGPLQRAANAAMDMAGK